MDKEIQLDSRRQDATIAQGECIKHFPLKTNNTESEINTKTKIATNKCKTKWKHNVAS